MVLVHNIHGKCTNTMSDIVCWTQITVTVTFGNRIRCHCKQLIYKNLAVYNAFENDIRKLAYDIAAHR